VVNAAAAGCSGEGASIRAEGTLGPEVVEMQLQAVDATRR